MSSKPPKATTTVALQIIKKDNNNQMLSAEQQRRAFERELEGELPSFAGLLGKLYRAADRLVEDLENPDLSSKDKVAILGQLSKSIPLLQQAESNHTTKLKEKDVQDMTTAELREMVMGYLESEVTNVRPTDKATLELPAPKKGKRNE
jgi:hypothetical protein